MSREPDVDWSSTASRARARVDVDAVGHVLDVLLDNAMRHGQGEVRVTVGRSASGATVDVADEGSAPTDRDPFAETGPTRRTGSACDWPARWPSRAKADARVASDTDHDVPADTSGVIGEHVYLTLTWR